MTYKSDTDEESESAFLDLHFDQKKRNSKFGFSEMESLKVDVNSNKKSTSSDEEQADLYDLLDIGLKSGRYLFFGASYSIESSKLNSGEFSVKNYRRLQKFQRIIHFTFCVYLIIPFLCERLTLSQCCLVNYIKKGLHVAITVTIAVCYYIIEIKGRRTDSTGLIGIYKQCILLRNKFNSVGIRFPSKSKVRILGWAVAILSCVICISRQVMFAMKSNSPNPWWLRFTIYFSRAISFGFWRANVNLNDTNLDLYIGLGTVGVIFDGILANYWFYSQIVHIFFVMTVWIVFDRLNRATKSGHFTANDMPVVIDLHFQSTKLLNEINEFMAPLTFSLMAASIVCLCFWTNYITIDFGVNVRYAAAICFFFKTMVEIILEADVNSKVHQITEWLEETCVNTEKFPSIDPIKFAVFTAQVYNKDCTGFRGLNFFVVTPRLAITVAGIVVTYTVAVNQFCHT